MVVVSLYLSIPASVHWEDSGISSSEDLSVSQTNDQLSGAAECNAQIQVRLT